MFTAVVAAEISKRTRKSFQCPSRRRYISLFAPSTLLEGALPSTSPPSSCVGDVGHCTLSSHRAPTPLGLFLWIRTPIAGLTARCSFDRWEKLATAFAYSDPDRAWGFSFPF
jgi:hypothetical protein